MQVYAMPVFDMAESLLVKTYKLKPTLPLRLIVRTSYVGQSSQFLVVSNQGFGNGIKFVIDLIDS
jgi:hypothetical protein